MAKFSIVSTITNAFETYVKHIVLLLGLGLTLGLVSWSVRVVPVWTAQALGIYIPAPIRYKAIVTNANVPVIRTSKTGINAELYKVGVNIGDTLTQKVRPYLNALSFGNVLLLSLVVALMSLFWLWVHIGAVRVLLDIQDKNKSNLNQLFSQQDLMFDYVLLSLLYSLLMSCIFLGVSVAGAIFEVLMSLITNMLGFPPVFPFMVAAVAVMLGMYVFVMRYLFSFYALIDRKKGPFDALSYSYTITAGNVMNLTLLFFILTLPFIFSQRLDMSGRFSLKAIVTGLPMYLVMGLVVVFYGLCFVYVYRKLGGKKA